ncbi:hypothetical protein ETQ85_00540 [Zoogloea oleivorans]|uniref:Uncharacterized protein n=1 Tax=Zoogloea oleivorans TaxID=1552750 RepID=A0A6C2D8E8_9RHOO|nr:hypothetical protein [Zoogloea oleivorans]MBP8133162.1 hypothetical protein [Zoogloea sp.]MBT9497298.1 hypothetical protein [Zoogloea sp.]TYC62083.1 hypothetical protein ETQ85_00540 [Zoogloea oleivorans]
MNPVFTALAAVAFGLMMLGGDASAAHKPAHHEPARKAAPHVRPVAKSAAPKPAAAPKATFSRGKAAKVVGAKVVPAKETRVAPKTLRSGKPEASVRAGKIAPVVRETATRGRADKQYRVSRNEVQPERPGKAGRRNAEPVQPAARRTQKPIGREAFVPIGREAFVPTSPPVRQAAARQALVIPPPMQPRPLVSAPPAAVPTPTPLRPTTELPKVAPRVLVPFAASAAGLSAAEAAAAAAAAVQTPEAAQVTPPAQVAPPASVPAVASPAQPPLAIQAPPSARPGRGLARAYAMDGATFYQSGRKIRVQGLDVKEPGMTSEHATQRLQRALDSGNLTVEPVEADSAGHTLAVVRVNGRNVADSVRAAAN